MESRGVFGITFLQSRDREVKFHFFHFWTCQMYPHDCKINDLRKDHITPCPHCLELLMARFTHGRWPQHSQLKTGVRECNTSFPVRYWVRLERQHSDHRKWRLYSKIDDCILNFGFLDMYICNPHLFSIPMTSTSRMHLARFTSQFSGEVSFQLHVSQMLFNFNKVIFYGHMRQKWLFSKYLGNYLKNEYSKIRYLANAKFLSTLQIYQTLKNKISKYF